MEIPEKKATEVGENIYVWLAGPVREAPVK